MNATVADTTERPVNVEEHARIVMGLLREYAGKLSVLATELLQLLSSTNHFDLNRVAWLLDQSEYLRSPLLAILSRGSGLRENAPLEPIVRDELSLRMFETEVHLHHVARLTLLLRDRQPKSTEQVAKMRVTAGLPIEANRAPQFSRPAVGP